MPMILGDNETLDHWLGRVEDCEAHNAMQHKYQLI